MHRWLRGPLRDWAEDLLAEKRLRENGFFNASIVRQRWHEHLSGKRNWQFQLWDVLVFQDWLRSRAIKDEEVHAFPIAGEPRRMGMTP